MPLLKTLINPEQNMSHSPQETRRGFMPAKEEIAWPNKRQTRASTRQAMMKRRCAGSVSSIENHACSPKRESEVPADVEFIHHGHEAEHEMVR